MAKASDNPITDLNKDWGNDENTNLPYSGQRVQEFIKSYLRQVIGAAWFNPTNYTMYFFENDQDRDTFVSDTSQTSLVKFSCPMSFDSTLYRVNITNNNGATVINTATNAGTLPLSASFVVQKKDLGAQEWEDLQTYCKVTIYIDKGVTGNFVPVTETATYAPNSTIEYDIFPDLIKGTSRVRITFEADDGTVTQSLLYTITMAELYVELFNNTWYMPIVHGNTDTYYLGGFRIGGAGSKTLHLSIYDMDGNQVVPTIDDVIGTTNIYANTPYFHRFSSSSAILGLETGTYRVMVNVSTDTMVSETIEYGIMYVAMGDINTAQLVVVNSVPESIYNFSTSTICEYSAYNKGLSSCELDVLFSRMNGSTVVDTSTTGLDNVPTSTLNQLTYYADWDVQGDGYNIGFTITQGEASDGAVVPLDNSTVFPPVSGYDFYLNAATRNNGDANKTKVVNVADNSEIQATWSMVDYIDGVDGWTTDDKNRKCLRIPAGTSFTLPYQLFSADGSTIEICYKVANVADWDEDVITAITNPSAPNFGGLRIKPTNVTLHAGNEPTSVVDTQRGTNVSDEEVIHLGMVLDRTFRGDKKIVKGFVNGGKNFAFTYTDSAAWNLAADLVIAPQKSDVFLYFVRHYPVALTDVQIQNNYISSLTTVEERTSTEDEFASVMDDGMSNVTLEAVKNAGYNFFVVHMNDGGGVPSKANGWSNDTTKLSSLEMHFGQHPEWDWQIFDTTTSGQGTTSMNYYRWNIRWRIDKNSNKLAPVRYLSSRTRIAGSYQYTWGATTNAKTVNFDGQGNHPAVMRITAKINQASSMQSHKMGATAAFTALHDALGLENEAQEYARENNLPHPTVSVYQYPAFGFQDDGNGNYSFCGLFTIGPDKGDKPTFGMDLVKSSLITMEGTDHSQPLAKFDHPWGSDVNFFYTQEGLAIAMPNGSYMTGLEVGNCHGKDTDKATGQDDCRTILNTEFKPAYDLAWNNSTLIFPIALGTYGATAAATLAAINSDDEDTRKAFRQTSYDGRLTYGDMQFWIEGERKLYYYDIKTDKYVAGQQLGTKTGTLQQQNDAYKADRRAAFMATAENYWHIPESIFHFLFLLVEGATDNHAKNTYPYKMATLQNGGRWRWWQDDLDSLFDIDNSGGDTKPYYIEFEDGNSGVPYFAGSNSVFWNLIFECYWSDYTSTETGLPTEGIRSMGKRMLKAMTSLSGAGNDYEGFIAFTKKYFWDKAQEYFPESAYNVDQFFKYEYAKFFGDNGGVDALIQELGNHYSAERLWVRRRAIYMLSLFGAGPFGDYSDASLGTVQFRPMSFSTTVVPSMWLYPAIGVGQGTPVSTGRKQPGESAPLVATGIDGNTFIYLLGTNCLSSLGNFKDLVLATGYVNTLEIPGKTLTSFTIGSTTPSSVTTNVPGITFGTSAGHTNCLEVIDARNAVSINTMNISAVPRLRKLLLAGTSITDVTIPRGSKINELSLPATITAIRLRDIKHLDISDISFAGVSNVASLVVENSSVNALELLSDIIDGSSSLSNIRLLWEGVIADSDGSLLATLRDVAAGDYKGIGPDGAETPKPVIEGQMTISGAMPVSEFGPVSLAFPTIVFDDAVNDQVYIDFADPDVESLALSNWSTDSDSTRLSLREAKAVTNLSQIFLSKTTIDTFDELEYFTGLTYIYGSPGSGAGAFSGCTNLTSVRLPSTVRTLEGYAFNGCTKLTSIGDTSYLRTIAQRVFMSSALTGDFNFPNVVDVDYYCFSGCKNITSVSLPSITHLGGGSNIGAGAFEGCTSLTRVVLNDALGGIGERDFYGCTALTDINLPSAATYVNANAFYNTKISGEVYLPNLSSIGNGAFYNTKITKIRSLGSVTTIGGASATTGAFGNCQSLTEAILPSSLNVINHSAFYHDAALVNVNFEDLVNIVTIGQDAFNQCTSLTGELNFPSLVTLGVSAFFNTDITKIISLGQITTTGDGAINGSSGNFAKCTSLSEVNLPSSLKQIGVASFYGCTALSTLTGGSGVTNIKQVAFQNCTSLISVSFPSLVTLVGSAFFGCTALSNVNLGNSLTSVGGQAFYNCSSITSLSLPATVTSLAGSAFQNMANLTELKIAATTPPSFGSLVFVGTTTKVVIQVPGPSLKSYMLATNASVYGNKMISYDGNDLHAVVSGVWFYKVSQTMYMNSAEGYAVTMFIPLRNAAHAIEFSAGFVFNGTDGNGCTEFFGPNHNYLNFYNVTSNPRTVTPASSMTTATYMRMTVLLSELANCYVLDTVDNVYLWRGSEVTTIY